MRTVVQLRHGLDNVDGQTLFDVHMFGIYLRS